MGELLQDRLRRDPAGLEREVTQGSVDLVRQLCRCASCFQPQVHGSLVVAVMRTPWRESEALAAAVLDFAQELVSAVPAFIKPCIDAMVVTFLPAEELHGEALRSIDGGQLAGSGAQDVSEAVLRRVHDALRGIIRACPLGIGTLYAAIKEHIPHRRRELAWHVSFLGELLRLLEYCNALRPRVVHLLVERLVDLDVQVAQQLRALEEAEDAEETIFEVEHETSAEELAKMRQNAEKLDTMLAMVCGMIRTTAGSASATRPATIERTEATGAPAAMAQIAVGVDTPSSPLAQRKRPSPVGASGEDCHASVAGAGGGDGSVASTKKDAPDGECGGACATDASKRSVPADPATPPPFKVARGLAPSPGSSQNLALESPHDPAEALFESLVSAFRASVLPTFKCRCVQFLVFYICSFNAEYPRAFLELLLSQLRSDHVHSEARIACAAYIASFLSRAKYVETELVLSTAREIVRWASDYQNAAVARLAGAPPSLDVQLHGPFYAAMQGLLYVLCYKYEALQAPQAGGALAELCAALGVVIHGPLNPLKFALEAVVLEFERLGGCDCSELITANERVVVASHTIGGARNQLEDYFPFDPLHGFKLTAEIIAPLFQEWVQRGRSEPRDSNLSALSEDADHSLSRSLQGMSMTPCSGDDPLSMGDLMRRRLHENRSLFGAMLGSPGKGATIA